MDLIRSLRDDEVASDELWDLAVSKGTGLLEQMGASPGDVVQSSFVAENDRCESFTMIRFRELEVYLEKDSLKRWGYTSRRLGSKNHDETVNLAVGRKLSRPVVLLDSHTEERVVDEIEYPVGKFPKTQS